MLLEIYAQSWALVVFLDFFNHKNDFCAFFIKLTWLGVGFFNKIGTFYFEKSKNTASAQLWLFKMARIDLLQIEC